MKHLFYKISFSICIFITAGVVHVFAQDAVGVQKKLLVRDSLDFKQSNTGFNTKAKEFNPIPFKDGLLFVSNKKTEVNKVGFNKVYWIPKAMIGKKDSLAKAFALNDDFTAPTSNDNNILYRFNKKKVRAANNAIENKFAEFIPEECFTIDDTAKYIVYPQLSKRKINGEYKWELWEALLINGKLNDAKKIPIKDSAADYIYPHLADRGGKLYFSSNRAGGKGGFDIYSIEKINGSWNIHPVTNNCVNTSSDELSPYVNGNDLFFSSNRAGGLGGYDLYRASLQFGLKDCGITNLGYPINSDGDDASIAALNNEFYLSSNKLGAMDIAAVQYQPVFIPVTGQLVYASDLSLLPNQALIVYDNDTQLAVDTIHTDANAKYTYNAKPNRDYSLKVKNADGFTESFALITNDKVVPSISYVTNLKGRSPRQIKDSNELVWAAIEQKRQDSIAAVSLENKFIVYYGFDKAYLTAKEKLVLDSVYNKLQKMPSTYLIVGAFTDCVGSFKYNYTLSVNRAKFVVNYLKKKGLPANRFVSNGYSKNYTITPCTVSLNKKAQQNNRRAEIVLSTVGTTNWAKLEKERGKQYYAVYSSKNIVKPVPMTKPVATTSTELTTAAVKSTPKLIKRSPKYGNSGPSLNPTNLKPIVTEVDTIAIAKSPVTSTIQAKKLTNVKDTISKSVSSLKKTVPKTQLVVKSTETKSTETKSKDTTKLKPIVQVAAPSTYVDDEISKAEILKALDSLATLKREQERIVEYLTKRINKKPIDVFVSSDSVTIEIYDNAIHDKDSVSIIFNNRIVVDKQELKVNKPIKFKLKVDKNKKFNEMIMVAENLGAEPPNTAVMFVTEKNGRRQQIMLSTDMLHNEVVYFIRIGKE